MTGPSREDLAARLADVDLHDELVNYEQAAVIAGVSVDAVKQWKSRHRLRAAGMDGRRPLFRPIDVLRAEAEAAEHPASRNRQPR